MSCPAVEILTEIRDLLAAHDQLAHKRAVKAAQQARYRAKKNNAATTVDTTQRVDTTKEEEKGKEEKSPRTPLKGVKGKEEERLSLTRAHARFVPPTLDEVTAYCRKRHNSVDPILWWNFYASKGWLVGKAKMVDWKRAVITWERGRPSAEWTDPKSAAFERQRAEAEARTRSAAALASQLIERRNAELEGGCHD